jgi:hypothetical protein
MLNQVILETYFLNFTKAIIQSQTGILKATRPKDDAIVDLAAATQELAVATRDVTTTAKNAPEDIGPALKKMAGGKQKFHTKTPF